jgi:Cu+-exporting ATPase
VVTLVRLGKLLEARAKSRTSAAIEQLLGLQPRTAWVERTGNAGGEAVEMEAALLKVGDVVRVRAGERVPVDGRVHRRRLQPGRKPAHRRKPAGRQTAGDTVHAGSQNLDGLLRVRPKASAPRPS